MAAAAADDVAVAAAADVTVISVDAILAFTIGDLLLTADDMAIADADVAADAYVAADEDAAADAYVAAVEASDSAVLSDFAITIAIS